MTILDRDQATGMCGNDETKITAVKNSAATVASVRCAGWILMVIWVLPEFVLPDDPAWMPG